MVPPAVVLVVSVLMGTKVPASLLLQGVLFAALTIAWVSVRHHRNRSVRRVAVSRSRLAAAGGLLAVSAISGVVVGPRLPGADDDRFVLRDEVEPPFDPLTEPSPLASYRNYTDQDVREDEIVTVRGLPDGARLRIAAMDAYSGTEWEATGSGSVLAGEYLRVGAEIPSEGLGPEADVSVEVHKPEGVWVPLAGDVTSVDFEGDARRGARRRRAGLGPDRHRGDPQPGAARRPVPVHRRVRRPARGRTPWWRPRSTPGSRAASPTTRCPPSS